jgi:2-oxoglutarate/2-oxoacid ferredoxin oxidoreductase subunit beta
VENLPKTWKKSGLPHKFCPGCGQALALKILGFAVDELNIADKTVYGCDIGCSLLTWNLFDIDTIQTHHGRVTPTMAGFKRAKPEAIVIAFMGDGGGYAIGAQHLINACLRDDKITVILINNANYAMTGGQMAPTTLVGEVTTTTPKGRTIEQAGRPIHGPEMLKVIAAPGAYLARCESSDFETTKSYIKKAISNQIDGRGFSFVEILAMCPVNWKMNAKESLDFVDEMKKTFPLGEIKVPEGDK